MDNRLIRLIDNTYSLLDSIDRSEAEVIQALHTKGLSIRGIFEKDVVAFVLYLFNSDGRVSKNEKNFLYNYFGLDLTYDEIKTHIKENKIDADDFPGTIPESIKIIVFVDNELYEDDVQNSGSKMIYEVFTIIGQAAISCDDNVTNEETFALSCCLNSIKKYINENSKYGEIIKTDPSDDSRITCTLKVEVDNYDNSIVEKIIRDNAIKRQEERQKEEMQFEQRRNEALSAAPWDPHYLDYPCPYCHSYKVRYAKWEDKQMSAAFWGFYSYKLHCSYKCDGCGKMWN